MTVCPLNTRTPTHSHSSLSLYCVYTGATVGFANGSEVMVGEGEAVRVCAELDVAPSLLQREIVLEGDTVPGTALGRHTRTFLSFCCN